MATDGSGRRLFVAVPLAARLREPIDRLCAQPAMDLRWVHPVRRHITLCFIGRADPDEAITRLAALSAVAPAEVSLGPATATFDERVLFLPASGLDAQATDAMLAFAGLGQVPVDPVDGRPFVGHLTLARSRGSAALPVLDLGEVLRFTATGASLFVSHAGGGPTDTPYGELATVTFDG